MKQLSNFFGCIMIFIMLTLTGCAATSDSTLKAAQTLVATQQTIVGVAMTANNLCAAGVLTQSQCDKVHNAYEKAKTSYDLVESSLATALKMDSTEAWKNYQTFNGEFSKLYIDLITLAASYGVEPRQ